MSGGAANFSAAASACAWSCCSQPSPAVWERKSGKSHFQPKKSRQFSARRGRWEAEIAAKTASRQTRVERGIKYLRSSTKSTVLGRQGALNPGFRWCRKANWMCWWPGEPANASQLWAGASAIRLIRGYPGGLGLWGREGAVHVHCPAPAKGSGVRRDQSVFLHIKSLCVPCRGTREGVRKAIYVHHILSAPD